ncbi:MAG: cytochrome C biogenesis protein ResB, partial [Planctomycetes bacterium]|nr:cytochrome C biogenesis protein ResB [Planctomycetota bacterium]
MGLAVALITLLAIVLSWATYIASHYGDSVAAFAIYRTGWFAVLLAVLGINVLNAALTRLPWKRRHVGFLVTHA